MDPNGALLSSSSFPRIAAFPLVTMPFTFVMPLPIKPILMFGMIFIHEIFFFPAFSDYLLVMTTFVGRIFFFIEICLQPGIALIDNYFIRFIEVVVPVLPRECRTVPPSAPVKIIITVSGDMIEYMDVREVIVLNIIVTGRSPDRLSPDVYFYTYAHLGIKIRGDEEKYEKNDRQRYDFHFILLSINWGVIFLKAQKPAEY
jgi:hypothetical protein